MLLHPPLCCTKINTIPNITSSWPPYLSLTVTTGVSTILESTTSGDETTEIHTSTTEDETKTVELPTTLQGIVVKYVYTKRATDYWYRIYLSA